MQIATYVDGRGIDYDETTRQLSIGGAVLTNDHVMGYDRAGQLTWVSPEMRNWFYEFAALPVAPATATPPAKKRSTGLVIGIIVGTLVLCGTCGLVSQLAPSSDEDTAKQAESVEKPATSAPKEQAEEPAAPVTPTEKKPPAQAADVTKIGEPLKVGDLVFTVKDAKTTTQLKSPFGDKKGNWMVVTVSVKNKSKEPVTINTSFFKLVQADGTTYETDGDNLMYVDPESTFFLEQINPNLEKTGKALFEIPGGAKGFSLQVQTGFWGTETGKIALTK